LWNKFLAIKLLRLNNKQQIMCYREMDFFSKLLKNSQEYGFLAKAHAHCIQQKSQDLERALLLKSAIVFSENKIKHHPIRSQLKSTD
jgi:hypothetical protein